MSDLTRCNHCVLEDIKREAAKSGATVDLFPSKMGAGGLEVRVDGKWTAWFMALTETCRCYDA